MEQNESLSQFIRFLKERHLTLKESIPFIHQTFVKTDMEKRREAVQRVLTNATTIRSTLANQDVPSWLKQLIEGLEWYLNNSTQADVQHLFLERITPTIVEVNNFRWNFDKFQVALGFDFDAIYEECKKNSRIDELFDKIIEYLQKVVDSGQVDSIKIHNTLNKLIATLKTHNSASYFSVHSTWDFVKHLIKNIMKEQLEGAPIVGDIIKALNKTLDETNIEMVELENKIINSIKEKYSAEFSFLTAQKVKLLEVDKDIHV
jgi:hypothetical protein